MAITRISLTTLDDSRLDVYTKLTERELRCVLEPEKGIFIAESAKVIERAVNAGLEPVSFLWESVGFLNLNHCLNALNRSTQILISPSLQAPWS